MAFENVSAADVRVGPEQILSGLAAVLPEAQKQLDASWVADLARTHRGLQRLTLAEVPALAQAALPPRFVFAQQTLQMTCHTSLVKESGAGIGVSVVLTPLTVGMTLRHRRAFDCACRLELSVERVPVNSDPPA
jgi:hypothetical protein